MYALDYRNMPILASEAHHSVLKGARLKAFLFALIAFLVLVARGYFSARADYGWAREIARAKQEDGWVLASTTANSVDFFRPWTIIRPSVTRVAFIRPTDVGWIAESHPVYRVLWVDRELGEDIFLNIAKCTTGESAFVEGDRLRNRPDPEEFEWRPNEPRTPGRDIVDLVCQVVDGL